MCVIIQRQPGIVIPEEKIRSACIVNPDGWGFSALDRGKLETHTFYDAKGNDPELVLKVLEEAKDLPIHIHLRYTTQGAKSLDNCHPFQVCKDGDYEMFLMHNGTIGGMTSKDNPTWSDSRVFANFLLKPLTRVFRSDMGDTFMDDALFKELVDKYRPGSSIFSLYDSNGKILNLGAGKQFEGWWASNDYSFNRTHREPSATYFRSSRGWDHDAWDAWNGQSSTVPSSSSNRSYSSGTKAATPQADAKAIAVGGSVGNAPAGYTVRDCTTYRSDGTKAVVESGVETIYDKTGKMISRRTIETKKEVKINVLAPPVTATQSAPVPTKEAEMGLAMSKMKARLAGGGHAFANVEPDKRLTFCDITGTKDLYSCLNLDENEIYDMCLELPVLATALIMDLIYELYEKKAAAEFEAKKQASAEAQAKVVPMVAAQVQEAVKSVQQEQAEKQSNDLLPSWGQVGNGTVH